MNKGTIMRPNADSRVRLNSSFPKKTAWGRAESFSTSIVPASSSLTNDRARPDKAEKVRKIQWRSSRL